MDNPFTPQDETFIEDFADLIHKYIREFEHSEVCLIRDPFDRLTNMKATPKFAEAERNRQTTRAELNSAFHRAIEITERCKNSAQVYYTLLNVEPFDPTGINGSALRDVKTPIEDVLVRTISVCRTTVAQQPKGIKKFGKALKTGFLAIFKTEKEQVAIRWLLISAFGILLLKVVGIDIPLALKALLTVLLKKVGLL